MGSAIMWLLGSWHFQSSNTNCPQQAQAHCPQGTQTGLQRGAGEAREPLWPRPQVGSHVDYLARSVHLKVQTCGQGPELWGLGPVQRNHSDPRQLLPGYLPKVSEPVGHGHRGWPKKVGLFKKPHDKPALKKAQRFPQLMSKNGSTQGRGKVVGERWIVRSGGDKRAPGPGVWVQVPRPAPPGTFHSD